MKPNYKQCWILLLALLVSPVAFAGIADEGTLYPVDPPLSNPLVSTFLPGYGTGVATVTSQVYKAKEDSNYRGNYIYTYIISGAQVNLSFFSVEILPNVEICCYGWDVVGKTPWAWEPVNDPVESIEALFNNPLKPGDTSATLWFISPQGPTEADGALAGITGGQYNFLVGKVLTPHVPEPTTGLLLAAGGLLSRFSRKRKS